MTNTEVKVDQDLMNMLSLKMSMVVSKNAVSFVEVSSAAVVLLIVLHDLYKIYF